MRPLCLCLELNALYLSTPPRNFKRDEKKSRSAQNVPERKKRREVPRVFSALFKSLSLCVCLSVSRPSQPPPPRLRAGARACVRVCVCINIAPLRVRGWLRFCAAHALGDDDDDDIFIFSKGNLPKHIVIWWWNGKSDFNNSERERRIRKEEKRTRFTIKRARARRTTSLMSC